MNEMELLIKEGVVKKFTFIKGGKFYGSADAKKFIKFS